MYSQFLFLLCSTLLFISLCLCHIFKWRRGSSMSRSVSRAVMSNLTERLAKHARHALRQQVGQVLPTMMMIIMMTILQPAIVFFCNDASLAAEIFSCVAPEDAYRNIARRHFNSRFFGIFFILPRFQPFALLSLPLLPFTVTTQRHHPRHSFS